MRVRSSALASLLLLFLATSTACGSDPDQGSGDPCRGVQCPQGYDCKLGRCVVREDPAPEGCESNNDCQFDARGRLCELETGRCVQCLETSHCTEGRSCEVGVCVGTVCTTNADCSDPTPVCATDGRSCVECFAHADCEDGEVCSSGSCQPAECSDEICAEADPDKPFCDAGACVECRGDQGCESGEICVDNACEPAPACTSNGDCANSGDGKFCDVDSGACVVCVDDSSCPFAERCVGKAACEPKGCEDTEDCPTGASCVEDVCVPLGQCGSDEDCKADPRVPRCNHSSVCVECLEDVECGAGKVCAAGACELAPACTSDSECPAGVCMAGSCAACRLDEHCPRGLCAEGACVDRASCSGDADCVSGLCNAGTCAECSSSLHCRPGLWCQQGECVEAAQCASNEDCGPGRLCDGAACRDAGCIDDGYEPDDGFDTATGITLGDRAIRTLCPNDEDWLVFRENTGTALDVTLAKAPEGAELSLVWFDPGPGRERMERRAVANRLLLRALPASATNRYYLRVKGGGGASGSYELLTKRGDGSCTDPLEVNNRWNDAVQIPTNTWLEGLTLCDQDFYLFDVPAGHVVRAYVSLADGDAIATLLTSLGGRIDKATSGPTDAVANGRLAAWEEGVTAGKVMLRIEPRVPLPSSYRLYVATVLLNQCVAPPLLLDVGGDRARVVGSTLGHAAAADAGLCGRVGPQAAYELRLDGPSRLIASVNAPFAASLALLDGACGAEQSCMPAAAHSIGTMDLAQVGAGTYTLVVGGTTSLGGSFDLVVRKAAPITPPANDLCANAIGLPNPGPTTHSIAGSTEAGTPTPSMSCAPGAPDVFYSFVVPARGRIVAEVEARDGQPAALALLQSNCSSQLACAEQVGPRIDRVLDPGTYFLRVASLTGESMAFTLKLTGPPTFANDACAGATTLAIPSTTDGDTTWAAADLAIPIAQSCTGYFTDGNDLFYKVSLAPQQKMTATLEPGAGYDGALYLIGSCAAPQCLAGSDKPGAGVEETLSFTSTAQSTRDYFLVVDGARGGGPFRLEVK